MKTKTAEEIYEEYIGNGLFGIDFEKRHIIEAMCAYASQFREISEISDEKINKMATEGEIKHPTLKYYEGFYDGARWYKRQLRKTKEI
jgi:hypothetical protein